MLTEDLFSEVLIRPITEFNPDSLNIVSGYASPSMVRRHFKELSNVDYSLTINLIIGMTRFDGISKEKHLAFVEVVNEFAFDCRYIASGNPVHAKVYTWLKNNKPILAFSGSANYSIPGFSASQREVLDRCDQDLANQFYGSIHQDSISCTSIDIHKQIEIKEHKVNFQLPTLDSVELSLLDSRTHDTHKKAGLNWGQRAGRDPDQAYIPIPSSIYNNTEFFPPVGEQFNVLTDDGEEFIFVRAQDNGKALEIPVDNSLMGLYFRSRIGVGSGEYVTRNDLDNYGRTSVTIEKVDAETYLLDFSVS